MSALRLGTRRSALAMAQSSRVAMQISERAGRDVRLVEIATLGDLSSAPIAQLGDTGVFVTALREALLRNEVDFVVHSYKDLPTAEFPGLSVAAVPPREDPRDALIWPGGHRLRDLPPRTRVGTSSARRAAELARLGLAVDVVAMRGNVDTRLGKLLTGEVDALLLAAAGLKRLGREEVITEIVDPAFLLPAPAQGALAVECRADDQDMLRLLSNVDDGATRAAVTAERAFLAGLDAGCTAPVGAYARLCGVELRLEGFTADRNLRRSTRCHLSGPVTEARSLGLRLAEIALAAHDTGRVIAEVPGG